MTYLSVTATILVSAFAESENMTNETNGQPPPDNPRNEFVTLGIPVAETDTLVPMINALSVMEGVAEEQQLPLFLSALDRISATGRRLQLYQLFIAAKMIAWARTHAGLWEDHLDRANIGGDDEWTQAAEVLMRLDDDYEPNTNRQRRVRWANAIAWFDLVNKQTDPIAAVMEAGSIDRIVPLGQPVRQIRIGRQRTDQANATKARLQREKEEQEEEDRRASLRSIYNPEVVVPFTPRPSTLRMGGADTVSEAIIADDASSTPQTDGAAPESAELSGTGEGSAPVDDAAPESAERAKEPEPAPAPKLRRAFSDVMDDLYTAADANDATLAQVVRQCIEDEDILPAPTRILKEVTLCIEVYDHATGAVTQYGPIIDRSSIAQAVIELVQQHRDAMDMLTGDTSESPAVKPARRRRTRRPAAAAPATEQPAAPSPDQPQPRRRGRPAGSKNKPKD